MCGVIVVDAGRSRSTCRGGDAYIHDHCLDIVMIIWSSINYPTVICSSTICYFSREKSLVKPTTPGSLSHIICLCDLFYLPFIFRSIKPKNTKIPCCNLFYLAFNLSRFTFLSGPRAISGTATRKGLATPLTRRVARICYLCAGAVYVVLLGSPTGSITLVSYLREILTATVLHHPFLFGEIPA